MKSVWRRLLGVEDTVIKRIGFDEAAACEALEINLVHSKPYRAEGRGVIERFNRTLILADCGGSNGNRSAAWKCGLQAKLCDPFGLTVTVSHYPPGASKWNPIEHRLFSEVSKNWAGQPLTSYQTMLNYTRTTRTQRGLSVTATLLKGDYPTGQKPAAEELSRIQPRKAPHPACLELHRSACSRNVDLFLRQPLA